MALGDAQIIFLHIIFGTAVPGTGKNEKKIKN
jgi:hypothetical protein